MALCEIVLTPYASLFQNYKRIFNGARYTHDINKIRIKKSVNLSTYFLCQII